MKYAFTKWKERTTTSSSGYHLGHYKALTVSDGEDRNEELKIIFFGNVISIQRNHKCCFNIGNTSTSADTINFTHDRKGKKQS